MTAKRRKLVVPPPGLVVVDFADHAVVSEVVNLVSLHAGLELAPPTPELTLFRRTRAWHLRCLGWTQSEIAADLGVTQQAVSKLLHAARVTAKTLLSAHIETVVAQQAEALRSLFAFAVRQGLKTPRKRRISTTEGRETVIEETAGPDPRWFALARQLLADERALLGIGGPVEAWTLADAALGLADEPDPDARD